MVRAVPISPIASYTIVPLSSPWPPENIRTPGPTPSNHKVVLAVAVLVTILLTTIGNALVCLAVLLVRKLKQPQNFLIVSLAVADFFVGLVVMPLALVDLLFDEWPIGSFMCSFYTTADLTLCTASIVNLCAISVDRYLVISRPLRYSAQRTTKRMLVYILAVWVVAAVVSFSSHIIANLLYDEKDSIGVTTCQVVPHFIYQIYATIIAFYGPTLIMVILNIKIWRAAKRLAKQDRILSHCNSVEVDRPTNNNTSQTEHSDLLPEKEPQAPTITKERANSTNSRLFKLERKYLHRPSQFFNAMKGPLVRHNEKSECKARKTLGVIMSVFIICWLPFFFLAILKSCLDVQVPYWLDTLTLWLGYSNSTLNPMIYCKYNKEFRVPFREMLACRCSTLQSVMRQQSFTSRYGPTVRERTQSSSYRPLLPRRNDSHAEASDV
ncbi:unnamed protein product [Caenorhabditis auriculariae]|uniref:G-protein coupled receptors family 1 profile domain-containing protein n=1 Tax=Caenorhabditis auriculariae TaxID=2777116 RepID=A0A8S1GNI4_9PELO|nr:unnamed protein product [Caenorhabditis auriculariae]